MYIRKSCDYPTFQEYIKKLNCNVRIVNCCRIGQTNSNKSQTKLLRAKLFDANECEHIISTFKATSISSGSNTIRISRWLS